MTQPMSGKWQITTETSVYVLDLDDQLATRVPDAGAGATPGLPGVPISSLRRDHEPIRLVELVQCRVGVPLRLLLDVRRDGIYTERTSTVVREVRELGQRT